MPPSKKCEHIFLYETRMHTQNFKGLGHVLGTFTDPGFFAFRCDWLFGIFFEGLLEVLLNPLRYGGTVTTISQNGNS